MSEDECGPSIICNNFPDITLDNIFISVYYLDFLQMEWCTMVECCYICIYYSLDLIKAL